MFQRVVAIVGRRSGHSGAARTPRPSAPRCATRTSAPASLSQTIRLLEQRPQLRGEMGESSTPPQEHTGNSE